MASKQTKQVSEGEFWADKLMDLANLSVAVLILGQLVVPERHWDVIGLGIVLYVVVIFISRYFLRR